MGVYTVNQTDGSLQRVAGGTLYADAPIGAIQSYGGVIAPAGWLICDGSAVSRTEYAELFAVIGINFGEGDGETTFGIPDLRECVPVGIGKNITKSIANHDRYDLGQFKDDQVQEHAHRYTVTGSNASGYGGPGHGTNFGYENTTTMTGRTGDTTHGKQLGVNYIIKAKMVGVPADLEAQIDADYQKKDLTSAVEGATTVEGALGALSTLAQGVEDHFALLGNDKSNCLNIYIDYDFYQDDSSEMWTTAKVESLVTKLATLLDGKTNVYGGIRLRNGNRYFGNYVYVVSSGYTYFSTFVGTYNTSDSWHLVKNRVTTNAYKQYDIDTYSTSETKTNKVWIDGKPIYRKVVYCDALPNATGQNFNHGISNIGNIVSIGGTAKGSQTIPIPHVSTGNPITIGVGSTYISITTISNMSSYSAYVILEYTKTTD